MALWITRRNTKNRLEAELRNISELDGILLVILASVSLLSFAKTMFPLFYKSFFRLPTNFKYIVLFGKGKDLSHPFHLLVMIASWMNTALFIYLITPVLFGKELPYTYLELLLFWVLFSVSKQVLQLIHGYIFENKRIRRFLFAKTSYFNLSSWLMLLSSIFILFTLKDNKPLIYTSILGVSLINLSGFWQVLRINQKYILSHFFYFILYLCAFEIAPFMILGSFLNFE